MFKKKGSHLAETEEAQLYLPGEREREGIVGRAESAEVVLRTAESAGKSLNLLKMCTERKRWSTCVAGSTLTAIHLKLSAFRNNKSSTT